MSKPEKFHMLWIDLETTGSELDGNDIIEIGALITDYDLNILASYNSVIQPAVPVNWDKISPVVVKMHTDNGLRAELEAWKGTSISNAEREILSLLGILGINKHEIALAGSGVGHFDRKFIARDMPTLNSYLKYYVIDVGVMRRIINIVGQPQLLYKTVGQDDKAHRAFDDIMEHHTELTYFRDMLGQIFVTFPFAETVKDYNEAVSKK